MAITGTSPSPHAHPGRNRPSNTEIQSTAVIQEKQSVVTRSNSPKRHVGSLHITHVLPRRRLSIIHVTQASSLHTPLRGKFTCPHASFLSIFRKFFTAQHSRKPRAPPSSGIPCANYSTLRSKFVQSTIITRRVLGCRSA